MSTNHTTTPKCACEQTNQHEHEHEHHDIQNYSIIAFSFVMLLLGILADYVFHFSFFEGNIRLFYYIIAYLPVAIPVLKNSFILIKEKDFLNEFVLMAVATIGAFLIGEYPEAVGVMLFYTIGEMVQDKAVNKTRGYVKELMDSKTNNTTLLRDDKQIVITPQEVQIGDILLIKVGERVPVDGTIIDGTTQINTSALTGESVPVKYTVGQEVLSGMINTENVIKIKAEKEFKDSALARIMSIVEDASSKKSQTELFIRRFSRVYTPIVFILALLVIILPYFIIPDTYVTKEWINKALVLLVISCPCALVISVPLSYFGGLGVASKHGILFKGTNYLERLGGIHTFMMDKTGTLTKGEFSVQAIKSYNINDDKLLSLAKSIESNSNHPIALAIKAYRPEIEVQSIEQVKELSGLGLEGYVDNKQLLAGNGKLLKHYGIEYPKEVDNIVSTIVLFALDKTFIGYLTIADTIKDDAKIFIDGLYKEGVKNTVMLSGDKKEIVEEVAKELGIKEAYGDLLPEDKLEKIKRDHKTMSIAFIGDGINDTPALALSDVGIAMGAMGSDVAVEVADVIIQTDQPSKVVTAMKISKATERIAIQNIVFAIGAKVLVILLGIIGIVNLWLAVFADVGVALIAIINAARILKKKFD